MTAQRSAVLYDPVRTAIGTFGGCLKDMPAASSYHWVGTRCLPHPLFIFQMIGGSATAMTRRLRI